MPEDSTVLSYHRENLNAQIILQHVTLNHCCTEAETNIFMVGTGAKRRHLFVRAAFF
jgi:hypothetical protein